MAAESHHHRWPGVPLALLSAALFGVSTPLAKLLLGSVDPWLLAGLLYLGAGLGLGAVRVVRLVRRLPATEAPLRRSDLPWLLAMIATGGIAGPLFLLYGLARTDAASGALLLNLESLATLAIAWLVFRENVDRRLLLGAAAILAGAVLLSWQGQGVSLGLGPLLIAAACVAWGVDNNLTRRLSAADPAQIAMTKGLVAGSVNLLLALHQGAAMPPPGTVLAAGLVGLGGYGVSLVLFVRALRHLGAARTGAYFALAPFIGAVVAILLLGDEPTIRLLFAGALMAGGLWLHLAERHQHEHAHGLQAHEHRHDHDAHHGHAHAPDDPPGEPHVHWHRHAPLRHEHPHYPDLHHRHGHR